MEVSGKFYDLSSLLPGKESLYALNKGIPGLQSWYERDEEEIKLPLPRVESRLLDPPSPCHVTDWGVVAALMCAAKCWNTSAEVLTSDLRLDWVFVSVTTPLTLSPWLDV